MNRHFVRTTAVLALVGFSGPAMAEVMHGILYKDPYCTCCEGHAAYLAEHDVVLEIKPTDNLSEMSAGLGVPFEYQGCHVILLDGYVIEGHVSFEVITQLLEERPSDVVGISLPGMPTGVPGMGGPYVGPYNVHAIHKDGSMTVYATQ